MPRRLKFIVAYDGAPFAGWQSQKSGNTIQDHLERAFRVVTRDPVRVQGAGRTDAGVHALGQCAHADITQTLSASTWVAVLNASLPAAIRVLRARYVADSFHARFSAKAKSYRYRIWNADILPPLERNRAWHVTTPLDLKAMQRAAALFVGRHDFTSFAANRGKPEANTERTIESARLSRAGSCVTAEFAGDGFLYKMVRLMIGALVRIGRGRAKPEEIRRRLQTPGETLPTARFTAPAAGLYLIKVRY